MALLSLFFVFLVKPTHNWVFFEIQTDKIGYYAQKMFDKCENEQIFINTLLNVYKTTTKSNKI